MRAMKLFYRLILPRVA